MRYLRLIIINIALTLISFEILAIFFIYFFNYTTPPRFFYKATHIEDNNPYFGVWHKPNSTFNHIRKCFNVYYNFNSYGARDAERSKKSKNFRGVILGDSFIEGYGLSDDYRISNILEKKIGKELLNFGTSGNFSTTQIALMYEHIVSKFDHDFIIVGLYPANDFDENSLVFGEKTLNKRYRPYRIFNEKNGSYDLVYFLNKMEESAWHPKNINKTQDSFLLAFKNMTHTGTLLSVIKKRLIDRMKYYKLKKNKNYHAGYGHDGRKSRFNQYSNEELELIKYDLLKIVDFANDKPLFLFSIPSINDFNYAFSGKPDFNRLGVSLKKFCNENNINYIDLYSELLKIYNKNNFKDLYFSCDGHFSREGSKISSEIIFKYLDSSSKINFIFN